MNCFVHDRSVAIGLCVVCQKALCRDCVGTSAPRLMCRTCTETRAGLGCDYRSELSIAGWPVVHICAGIDPVTMRPRIARGILAVGNIAVGGVAIGGLACGVVTVGGASLGLALALGGAAVGLGVSVGGLAIGSVALGGAAIGLVHAIGGWAFAPSIIDGRQCDPAALEFVRRWLETWPLPPSCR